MRTSLRQRKQCYLKVDEPEPGDNKEEETLDEESEFELPTSETERTETVGFIEETSKSGFNSVLTLGGKLELQLKSEENLELEPKSEKKGQLFSTEEAPTW